MPRVGVPDAPLGIGNPIPRFLCFPMCLPLKYVDVAAVPLCLTSVAACFAPVMKNENTKSPQGSSSAQTLPEVDTPALKAVTQVASVLAGYALLGGFSTLIGWFFG